MGKIGVGVGEEFPVDEGEDGRETAGPESNSTPGDERGQRCTEWQQLHREWHERWEARREGWCRRYGGSHFGFPFILVPLLAILVLWGLISLIFHHLVFFMALFALLLFVSLNRHRWHDRYDGAANPPPGRG